MSLRDTLASKSRRRETIPVQVSDPAEDLSRAAEARALAVAAVLRGAAAEEVAALEADAATADDAVRSHYADVEFQAMDPRDFEALLMAHTDGEADTNSQTLRPALAAACAVDEDLRDEEWWATQFDSGSWSKGELDDIYYRLFSVLNYSVPRRTYPKG